MISLIKVFKVRHVLGLLCIVFLCSCGEKELLVAPKVDADFAYETLKDILAISPRTPGSSSSKQAVMLIAERSKLFADTVVVDAFVKKTPHGDTEFSNIIAEVKGADTSQYVIVGSHFDTKYLPGIKDFQGANDSGSSTAVLIAMMKAIKESGLRPPVSLRFTFFDGEECYREYDETDGLYGSRHYASKLEASGELSECRAMVLLDMVGDKDLRFTIPQNTDAELLNITNRVAEKLKLNSFIGRFDGDILDDFIPFQKRGVPCIDLIDFEFGPNNIYWHTSMDTLDKISPDSLKVSGDLALGILWQLR